MQEQIKEMIEAGFAARRVAIILNVKEDIVRGMVSENSYYMAKENFTEDKIDKICELYKQGVSAKQLGIKFSIDKRRIQKWAKERGNLRTREESHRFTEFNEHILDVIDTPEKAYWLGMLYADGFNADNVNTVSLTLKEDDLSHVEKFADFLAIPKEKTYHSESKKFHKSCTCKAYSKHLCTKLTELGCPRAKSFIITFPEWLDSSLHSHFIRGMFDGDGCLTLREKQMEWKWSVVTTQECAESIQYIVLEQLGFLVGAYNISKTGNNTVEMQKSGNESILKLMEWLYKDSNDSIRLTRKFNKYEQLKLQQENRAERYQQKE